MWFALALSVALVIYNNVINRWSAFQGAAYVPINLAFAGSVTLVTAATLDLTSEQFGFRGDPADVAIALGLLVLFAVVVFALALSRHGNRIADERVAGMHGGALAFYTLVRIPFGTAVSEEILFRGVLFAAWREAGVSSLVAALCASVAFGLWHVMPTIIGVRMNDPSASARKLTMAVLGAVVATTIAGLALTWLRLETEGLLAPILIHAGINSTAALAAVTAHRRRDERQPRNLS
jgi:membrane protease YdiL (CAAX protease family)